MRDEERPARAEAGREEPETFTRADKAYDSNIRTSSSISSNSSDKNSRTGEERQAIRRGELRNFFNRPNVPLSKVSTV
jgi:hypothetical protein